MFVSFNSNTTDATRNCILFRSSRVHPCVCGVRIPQCLVFCVVFCRPYFDHFLFSIILSVVFDLWLLMNPLVSRIMCHRITLYIEWCASLRCSDRMIVKFTSISVKSTRSDEDSDEMSSIKHYVIQFSTYIRVIYMDIVCCFGCIHKSNYVTI